MPTATSAESVNVKFNILQLDLESDYSPQFRGDESFCGLLSASNCTIRPKETVLIPTGIAFEIPCTHFGQIAQVQSDFNKKGFFVFPTKIVSRIDEQIFVIIKNVNSKNILQLHKGDPIARIFFLEKNKCFFT